MQVEHHIKLEQSQKLIMTTELRQAIALLQMSTHQLLDYVQEELTSNPVLEWEEEAEKKEEDGEKSSEKEQETKEEEFPWEEYFQENYYESFTFRRQEESENTNPLENLCRNEEPLSESLFSQARMILDTEDHPLVEFIIGCIDANGYLCMEVEEIASALNIPTHRVERVLDTVKCQLEPAGIGARDLKECLLLQLERREDYPVLAETLIRDHLPAVADGRFKHLAEKLSISMSEFMEAVEYIKTLNPKPGNLLGNADDIRYIVPDVIVEKVEGDYVVIVNDSVSPNLRVNPYYRSLMHRKDGEATTFVKKCLDRALWLMKSIEQRRLTLYRVSEHIVRKQKGFLDYGLKHLTPLTLKEVADVLDIHESTVSRATSHKYLQTPRGVFPFKFFFSSRIESSSGEIHSSTGIKTHLKEIIEQESPHKPYSDSKITNLLKERGIDISRRTVAKYREELLIPGSHKRKQG